MQNGHSRSHKAIRFSVTDNQTNMRRADRFVVTFTAFAYYAILQCRQIRSTLDADTDLLAYFWAILYRPTARGTYELSTRTRGGVEDLGEER